MKLIIGAAVFALSAVSASAAVVVTAENAGVQNTTDTSMDVYGVETFNNRTRNQLNNFTSNFGTSGATQISGAYSGGYIRSADVFGGAGGDTRYIESDETPYTITFTTSNDADLNYFGLWLSALDGGNHITFYKGNVEVFAFTPATMLGLTGNCPSRHNDYCANPNREFRNENKNEPYAFLNFYFKDGQSFDKIKFFEKPNIGDLESDNHTVGYFLPTDVVPEPATWAMLIAGFGLVGMAARRRRGTAAMAIS